jgi:hypothetical protein
VVRNSIFDSCVSKRFVEKRKPLYMPTNFSMEILSLTAIITSNLYRAKQNPTIFILITLF